MQIQWILALVLSLVANSVTVQTELLADCEDIFNNGHTLSSVYVIYPTGESSPVQVYCDMGCNGNRNEGRWTVIQRRMDGTVNFYRPWDQYKKGFGDKNGEYWLGLEWLHQLTGKRKYELRVDMEDFEGTKVYAHYFSFSVASEEEGYKLTVSGFTDGGAGDSLTYHSGQKFSTFDKDQDSQSSNCAKNYLGAFWYKECHYANPNGIYKWGVDATYRAAGVVWYHWKGYEYSLKSISMKIRPVGTS